MGRVEEERKRERKKREEKVRESRGKNLERKRKINNDGERWRK